MAIPTQIEATALPDISASWSGRNGGQVLLSGGGLRAVMSPELAADIRDKLTRALDFPKRAAEAAALEPVPEPTRIAAPDTMLAEAFRHRKAALIGAFPSQAKRLAAIALALEHAEGADVVMVGGISFLLDEAESMLALLTAQQIGRRAN